MQTNNHIAIGRVSRGFIIGLALSAMTIGTVDLEVLASSGDPTWQPQASERLVKLPANYIKRSLEKDFNSSELGQALLDIDTEISFKAGTLADLEGAIKATDGEMQTDLRHQFLLEKQEYIDLVSRKNQLRRRALEKKSGVLEELMTRLGQDAERMTPARRDLINHQVAARERFQTSIPGVDMELLEISVVPESKYARQFANNVAALDSLSRAIEQHPMNRGPVVDGIAVTREVYLRKLIAEAQAEIELLGQEKTILGYMAKLVALDATALSEDVADTEFIDSNVPANETLTDAVKYFLRQ